MPDPALLSPLGQTMLGELPPVLRGSKDYLAVIHCYAREFDRFEGVMESLRAQFNPATADVLLPAWEFQFHLPVGGNGASIEQRRKNVLSRIAKLTGQAEGREWEQELVAILGAGWTYQEHDVNDGTSPAAGVLRVTVPFQSGTARFIEAQNQVADVTPAHLQLLFVSAAGFQLGLSQLDVTQFGY